MDKISGNLPRDRAASGYQAAVEKIRKEGESVTFCEAVYKAVSRIPAGKVATYGQIACLAGNPRAARAVGWALRRCPSPDIPCHRVVNRSGGMAPADIFDGADGQRVLLAMEGVLAGCDGRVDMERYGWQPTDSIPGEKEGKPCAR